VDSVVAPGTHVPVTKSITVKASPQRAFEVFTSDFDSWWPRTHHIGKAPLQRAILEPRQGGRCYTEHVDGSACDWGQVIAWEPPHRLVLAWQVHGDWTYAPDPSQSSEVEIRFTPEAGGVTRVDLEHRHIERHGASAAALRTAVDAPSGWTGILQAYGARVEA
jgi:uncharacterized protein YndB with AHSA1/START domain